MTKQEQIYGIAKYVCNACEFGIYKACSERQTDVKSCSLALNTAKHIYNAGYRKVPDGAVVLTPEERDDEMKATNEILAERDDLIAKVGVLGRENYDLKEEIKRLREVNRQLNNDYNRSYERLKSDCREIAQLKAENEELKAKLEKNPLAIKQKIMEEDDYELTEREQATLFLDRMGSDLELLHDMVENLDELLGKGIDEYIMGRDGVEGLKDMWERSAVMAFAEKLKAKSEMFLVAKGCGIYGEKPYVSVEQIDERLKEYE